MRSTKRIGHFASIGTCVAALIATLTGCGSSSDNNNISVAVITDYPPITYSNQGQITGYEAELMTDVAKAAGLTINWHPMAFSAFLTSIQSGQIQAGVAGVNINPKREKIVDFSTPTFVDHNVVVVLKNSPINSLADLKGDTIVGTLGSNTYVEAQSVAQKYGATAKAMTGASADYQAVQSHQADALVMTRVSAAYNIDKLNMPLKVVGGNLNSLPTGFVVSKSDSWLLSRVDSAMSTLAKNGTIASLKKKWLGDAASVS